MFGTGMLITNMTGNFNLRSSSGSKFNPLYSDPFVFAGILYCDYHRLFEPKMIAAAYGLLVLKRVILYFLFMRGMVIQICDYLCIPFLRVKQEKES